jgi:hypothetical protein
VFGMSALATAVIEVPDLSSLRDASDSELKDALRRCAEARKHVDAVLAALSGEVERRSARDLGNAGLAQSSGARTSDVFVTQLTGLSGVEARQLVTVGGMLDDAEPWLAEVASAVASGEVSVGAAAAIRSGLGTPTAHVAADDLQDAAHRLIEEAATLPPEKVVRRARELRDELDPIGVGTREEQLREKRWLRVTQLPTGMWGVRGELDPETKALVFDPIHQLLAPRRGGPRFVDAEEAARAEALEKDHRTYEQLTVDALVDLVRVATSADPQRLFRRRPAVLVHVDARDLAAGDGSAWIEGQTTSVSVATARRLACADGYQPIVFEPDGSTRLGRTQRLFSEKQRLELAAIWGGCAVEGCDRPPSMTEAHHRQHWSHGGPTDTSNGILLCRHHHMLLHNGGWSIDGPPGRHLDGWVMTDGVRVIRLLTKNPVRQRSAERLRTR